MKKEIKIILQDFIDFSKWWFNEWKLLYYGQICGYKGCQKKWHFLEFHIKKWSLHL